ncbi:MAG: RNase adapter RapZ [Desulfococcaceae bacterium]
MKELRIFILTGLSGSGKSTAMAAFEDAGFYCVDNLPVALLPKLLELPIDGASEIAGFAFVMDLRERGFVSRHAAVFQELRDAGYRFEILFFEAEENVLVRRFSETRRNHPLSRSGSVLEGIREEKSQLAELRDAADQVVDTTGYTVHELKSLISDLAQESQKRVPMRIRVTSFGFKFGVPTEADVVMDVRFLTNPFFIPELKPLDGRTAEVRDFVLDRDETRRFLANFTGLLDDLIPQYEREGKAYLTIAIGCTGGRHRSVAVATAVYDHIRKPDRWVDLNHRDIDNV